LIPSSPPFWRNKPRVPFGSPLFSPRPRQSPLSPPTLGPKTFPPTESGPGKSASPAENTGILSVPSPSAARPRKNRRRNPIVTRSGPSFPGPTPEGPWPPRPPAPGGPHGGTQCPPFPHRFAPPPRRPLLGTISCPRFGRFKGADRRNIARPPPAPLESGFPGRQIGDRAPFCPHMGFFFFPEKVPPPDSGKPPPPWG